MNINWFPGHMAKTRKQITDDLKLVDVVIEILDARIPFSSQNPEIKQITKNKKKVIVLNKSDLSDENDNKRWVEHFIKQGTKVVLADSNTGKGINEVIKQVQKVFEVEQQKFSDKGRVGKSIRIMILGIPNVGKSSFINRITKKNTAQVGNRPGVTRQKQWIRLQDGIELMDTPGVLWPKFESEEVGMHLAFTGSIKDDILEKTEIAFELLKYLVGNYKDNIIERYKLEKTQIENIMEKDEEENTKILEILDMIAKKRGAILSGGRIDYEKISIILLDEFRSAKIGRITLEKAKI